MINYIKYLWNDVRLSLEDRKLCKLFFLACILGFIFSVQELIYFYWSLRFFQVFKLLYLGVMAYFIFYLFKSKINDSAITNVDKGLIRIGWFFVLYMLVCGLIFNMGDVKVYTFFSYLIYFGGMMGIVTLGLRLDLWKRFMDLFLIAFYVAVIIMLATKNVQYVIELADGGAMEFDELRGTNSLAYRFRGLLYFSLFFMPYALFSRDKMHPIVRCAYLFSIVPFIYFGSVVSKFRSNLLVVVVAFCMIGYYSIKTVKIKTLILLAMCLLIGFTFYNSSYMEDSRDRMHSASDRYHDNSLFSIVKGEREAEFEIFMTEVPLIKKIIGGGFGASYDASELFGREGEHWHTIHIGFVSYVLFGGVGYLIYMLFLYYKSVSRRLTSDERNNGFLLCCKVYIVVYFVRYCVTPITISDRIYIDFLLWLSFGALLTKPIYGRIK